MIRNLKALGLLAFAVLAMSAMLALTASAEEGQKKGFYAAGFTPKEFKTSTLVGKQYGTEAANFFEIKEGKVTCDNATYTSTILNGTQKELTVTPHYLECQSGTSPATVTMNGCDFIFTQPTTAKDAGAGNYTAKVGLTCPHENKIQIHAYLFGNSTSGTHSFNVCTVEVWPTGATTEPPGETKHRFQEYGGNSHVILDTTKETVEGKEYDDVTIKATVEGITYKDNCHGGEEAATGTYSNTVTATAWNDDELPHNKVTEAWIEEEA